MIIKLYNASIYQIKYILYHIYQEKVKNTLYNIK